MVASTHDILSNGCAFVSHVRASKRGREKVDKWYYKRGDDKTHEDQGNERGCLPPLHVQALHVPGKSHSNVAVLRFVMPFATGFKFCSG